jgi:hypothetical protein
MNPPATTLPIGNYFNHYESSANKSPNSFLYKNTAHPNHKPTSTCNYSDANKPILLSESNYYNKRYLQESMHYVLPLQEG